MRPNPSLQEQEALARRRAELIVQVRSGRITATEAARQLGVSRKTYYQWERRALCGMIEALQDKEGGRPPIPRDAQKENLQKQVEDLEARQRIQEQVERIRAVVGEARTSAKKTRR
jgi:DNA-binding XRE family transcriptional regulator